MPQVDPTIFGYSVEVCGYVFFLFYIYLASYDILRISTNLKLLIKFKMLTYSLSLIIQE